MQNSFFFPDENSRAISRSIYYDMAMEPYLLKSMVHKIIDENLLAIPENITRFGLMTTQDQHDKRVTPLI